MAIQSLRDGPETGFASSEAKLTAVPSCSLAKEIDSHVLEVVARAFDKEWYLAAYPDVADFEAGPLMHYLLHGLEAGYDPTPDFSTHFYAADNPDVIELGINPFYHYLTVGIKERRHPMPPGGSVSTCINQIRAPREESSLWRAPESVSRLSQEDFEVSFKTLFSKRLYLSLSHDLYVENVGGIQQCIAREEKAALQKGSVYLHLSPFQPLPMLSEESGTAWKTFLFNVVLNGRVLGQATGASLKPPLSRFTAGVTVVYHALHGHSPEIILRLLEGTEIRSHILWIHDYFTLCPGYNLLRNGVNFCGVPDATSNACRICVFGGERPSHTARMSRLFENATPHVIAPSKAAEKLWKSKSRLKYKSTEVVEHVELLPSVSESEKTVSDVKTTEVSKKIKIAYLGFPSMHKGGPDFKSLHRKFIASNKYQFLHLGQNHEQLTDLPMEFVPVECTPGNPTAMVDAVRSKEIDLVFLPSAWPETFNLICYEAVAGGAKVICYSNSGNIADFVSVQNRGFVVDSFEEVVLLLEKGFEPNVFHKNFYDLRYSKMAICSKGDWP